MKLYFHMSEGQSELFPDWYERHLEVEVEGDIQIVYNGIRDENADLIAVYMEEGPNEGFWVASADNTAYSDIAITP